MSFWHCCGSSFVPSRPPCLMLLWVVVLPLSSLVVFVSRCCGLSFPTLPDHYLVRRPFFFLNMSSLSSSSPSTPINDISHMAAPVSRNPFLTPEGHFRAERDSPLHLSHHLGRQIYTGQDSPPEGAFSRIRLLSPSTGSSVSDNHPLPTLQLEHMPSFDDVYGTGTTPARSTHPPPAYNHTQNTGMPIHRPVPVHPANDRDEIKEKTMVGVPTWPANLRLSLNANNWLEWSRKLINGLKMAQLHVYPLGLLACPNQHLDRSSHRNWHGNDQMILGYITAHIFPSESQYITNCVTSADAYRMLRQRHEKHGGLKQTQLIQQLMHVHFEHSLANSNAIMTHIRDLVYRIKQIGTIDVAKLACLFLVHGLRSTHPLIHEALVPVLMDGMLTMDELERKLMYHYELEMTYNPDQFAFPAASPVLSQSPLASVHSSPTSPTVALPASLPPRANVCPNCKNLGHSIDFCVAPGGKMEGYTTADAIACQRTTGNAQRGRAPPSDTPSDSPIRLERDGIIWIGGVWYQPMKPAPHPEPTTASITEVTVESAMTAADQGEYSDWTFNNGNPSWGSNDDVIDTASFLLAATDTALIARGDHDPPLCHDLCPMSIFPELTSW